MRAQRRKLGACDIFVHVHAFLLVIQVVVNDCNSCKSVIHGLGFMWLCMYCECIHVIFVTDSWWLRMCEVKYVIEKWEKKTKMTIRKRNEGDGRVRWRERRGQRRRTDMTESRHLYRVSHPIQMCLPHLYRFNNQYKCGLRTGTKGRFSSSVKL
jgi:hypothetical protein